MMSTAPARLAAFGAGLVLVFGAAFGAGRLGGPLPAGSGAAPPMAHRGSGGEAGPEPPAGLQVAQDGYRLVPLGDDGELRFRIDGPDGRAVTGYRTEHTKQLHLIVVRRDLSAFRHVHPVLGAGGVWSVPLTLGAPGQYRVFADFTPAARTEGLTLGVDLDVPGDYRPVPLPAPERTVEVDGGYSVTREGDLHAGVSSSVGLRIALHGVPLTDLEPYLGASGHLVALRQGDLAYLHVHPESAAGDLGPVVRFAAEVPSAGTYRLYLDFQHGGRVHTAELTAVAT